jgi:phosphatidylglycerophosphate synthase
VAAVADALGLARLAAAALAPGALANALDGTRSVWTPLALFGVAATSDFLDGRLARAAGRSTRHGAALDNAADIAFVLAATGAGAAHGLVSWAAPAAIATAFAAYVIASLTSAAAGAPRRRARSRIGHAGGVLNYTLAGLIAGAVAIPNDAWHVILAAASVLVIAVNLAAVLARVARASRA